MSKTYFVKGNVNGHKKVVKLEGCLLVSYQCFFMNTVSK